MVEVMSSMLPLGVPGLISGHRPKDLPFRLDLSCPISLPSKHSPEVTWPYRHAGPSRAPDETPQEVTHRRYLECLFLSDVLSHLPSFAQDILSLSNSTSENLEQPPIDQLLLSLPQIEKKYRKDLVPLTTALTSSSGNPAVREESIRDAIKDCGLDSNAIGALKMGVHLRASCRAMEESSGVIVVKKLLEEFERRETLIQVILLLIWSIHCSTAPVKKRKRKHQEGKDRKGKAAAGVVDDPVGTLDMLIDRLSVWHAVADLGISMAIPIKGKEKEDDGMQGTLRRVWDQVIQPMFLPLKPDLCATFHLKVFGKPIPQDQAVIVYKKSRKPKITTAKPSTDELTANLPKNFTTRPIARAPSVVSTSSRRPSSPPPVAATRLEDSLNMRRSVSRTSESLTVDGGYRRSRSRSVDPIAEHNSSTSAGQSLGRTTIPKKPLGRAPSGKDLFKGREVGLMRRSASIALRKEKELAREETQKIGLLGRKASDIFKRRVSGEGESQRESQAKANTIIFATPSKPRFFGPRSNSNNPHAFHNHPTPIQEEPSSGERPSFIAETPVGHQRISEMSLSGLGSVDENDSGEESDDPLAGYMVMTDDEDEGMEESPAIIPETPAR